MKQQLIEEATEKAQEIITERMKIDVDQLAKVTGLDKREAERLTQMTGKRLERELDDLDIDPDDIPYVEELFSGRIYKDKSQLPGGKLKRNVFDIRKHITSTSKKLRPIFVIGYELHTGHVFYEIWYLPFEGSYVMVDNFGKRIGKRRLYDDISDAADDLVDVIAKQDITFDRRDERDFEKDAEDEVRRGRFEYTNYEEDKALIESILEQSVASRRVFADIINDEIEEYSETRISKHKISRLWGGIIGRDIKFPTKYISSKASPLKIVGKKKEALFVVGYTLADKIDIEIWFVKSLSTGKGSFYVFDLTSGKLLADKLPTMRKAYAEISKKITIKA